MFIIVAGGGKQGYYLVKDLRRLDHEVILIEKDEAHAQELRNVLGALVHVGDACEEGVLRAAGAERADFIAAVTGEDEDNLVICQVAKNVSQHAITISRVNNPGNSAFFHSLGIDSPVSATEVIVQRIEEQITTHSGALTSLLRSLLTVPHCSVPHLSTPRCVGCEESLWRTRASAVAD